MWRSVTVCGFCVAILAGSGDDLAAQQPFNDGIQADFSAVRDEPVVKLRLPPRATPTDSGSTKSRATAPTASLWGTVAALVVVLGGMLVAARTLRKHGPAGLRTLPQEAVEPLGQRLLARGVSVHLLRCGSRMLLVGVGPDGVRTLSEITDPVEVDLLTGACRRPDGERPSFAKIFQREQTAAPQNDVEDRLKPGLQRAGRYIRPGVAEVEGV